MKPFTPDIGLQQGGLSPGLGWREELALAAAEGFKLIEWVVEEPNDDPLMTRAGRKEMRRLSRRHAFRFSSLAAKFFERRPFFKAAGLEAEQRFADLARVAAAARDLDIRVIVLSLTGEARLESPDEARRLSEGLASLGMVAGLPKILLVADLEPSDLVAFIAPLPDDLFGLCFDTDPDAVNGVDPEDMITALAARIDLVRVGGGSLVPHVPELDRILRRLARIGYRGGLVLKTGDAIAAREIVRGCLSDAV